MRYYGIIILLLTGCGQEHTYIQTQKEVPAPSTVVDAVSVVIQEENAYRNSVGQSPLAPGLNCSLYNVATSTPSSIPSNPTPLVGSFAYIGAFNQPNSNVNEGLNVLPQALRNVYTTWYVLRCTGYLLSLDSVYQNLYLTSDDGANLYINNSLVINNDGLHGVVTKSTAVYTRRGVTPFRIDYLQAGGQQALVIENSFGVVNSNMFYR